MTTVTFSQSITNVPSFCRKTTLKKHIVRDHHAGSAADLSGNDYDEDLDEDESPSPPTRSQELPYDRSYWNLPPQIQVPSFPVRDRAATSDASFEGHQIKREASLQMTPFAPMTCRTTSDPTYIHYAPPNMNQSQLQDVTSAPMRTPPPMDSQGLANHGNFNNQGPLSALQTNMDMMHTFSSPDQLLSAQSLHTSPSTMSAVSTGPESSVSQDYRREYASPDNYQPHPSYDVSQTQISYPHLQPLSVENSCSVPTGDLPRQEHTPHQQQMPHQHYAYHDQQAVQGIRYQALQQDRDRRLQQLQMQRHVQQTQVIQRQQEQDQERHLQQLAMQQGLQQMQHMQHMQRQQQTSQDQYSQVQHTDLYSSLQYQEPVPVENVTSGLIQPCYGIYFDYEKPEDTPDMVIPGWQSV